MSAAAETTGAGSTGSTGAAGSTGSSGSAPAADVITVDPWARCDSDAVGAGTVVWAFAHVDHGAVLGRSCKVGEHSYIEGGATLGDRVTVKNGALIWRGVRIGDDVFVGPRATFTNDPRPRAHRRVPPDDLSRTTVRTGASLGASVTVRCGVTIGEHAMVGAGTLVVRDVPAHALVVGVPGRQVGWVCRCGETLDAALRCSCGRSYRDAGPAGLAEVGEPVADPEGSSGPVHWAPV